MLILSRKVNERLIINGDIEVVILDASKNSVRIGVDAPDYVRIYREEVYKEILKENAVSGVAASDVFDKLASSNKKAFDILSKLKK